jgi:hypothetical protein
VIRAKLQGLSATAAALDALLAKAGPLDLRSAADIEHLLRRLDRIARDLDRVADKLGAALDSVGEMTAG